MWSKCEALFLALVGASLFVLSCGGSEEFLTGNVVVGEVLAGSPAKEGGLQIGDIVLQAGGEKVESDSTYSAPSNLMAAKQWSGLSSGAGMWRSSG